MLSQYPAGVLALSGSVLLRPDILRAEQESLPALSPSVLAAVRSTGTDLLKAHKLKKATSVEVRAFKTSLEILHGHLDETGYSHEMYTSIKNAGFFDVPPTFEELSSARKRFVPQATDIEFSQIFQAGQIAFPRMQKLASTGNLSALNANTISFLALPADRLDKDKEIAESRVPRVVRVQQLESPPDQGSSGWFCLFASTMSVYFGTWSVMAYIGAAVFTPVGDIIILISGLLIGAGAYLFC